MFTLIENIINSIDSILSNKLRATLSMLGIIIGVSSVIILTAIGDGSKQTILDKVEEMGTNMLTLTSGGFGSINSKSQQTFSLNEKTLKSLENISGLKAVLPIISGNGQVIFEKNNSQSQLQGVTKNYFKDRNVEIIAGNDISQENIDNYDKVAVIGQDVLTNLFNGENPIGKKIKYSNNIFEVIGVIGENSQLSNTIFIPISTASIRILGQKNYSQIIIYVEDSTKTTQKQEEITQNLIDLYSITNTQSLPFRIINQSQMLSSLSSITETLTMLLSGIAGISLLVGGIGVMNIMLVSVSERTKEIGIKKALGALKIDILLQFLTESSLLSILGGFIGILFSYFVVYILSIYDINAIISIKTLIISFCFSLGIGIFFGILPAYKASKLRPIEALRFE
ncbi:ABC transporter permease [Candidatus Gracilibacteria bacterium]|nr:ABC transporter permease [Candidatus Gracilibacteria bacterium]